jgi:hypothetical protein
MSSAKIFRVFPPIPFPSSVDLFSSWMKWSTAETEADYSRGLSHTDARCIKGGYYDTSYSRGDVNQKWILKNSKDQGPSPHAMTLKHLTSLPSTQLSPLKTKNQIKEISPTVFNKQE